MSLNDLVKGLYRGTCALVASAAIYVGGCASDVKQPQSQPSVQESPFSQSQPTGEVSSAVIFIQMSLGADYEADVAVPVIRGITEKCHYAVFDWVNLDGLDGVFDDTFDLKSVSSLIVPNQHPRFDFSPVNERGDSELFSGEDSVEDSFTVDFDSVALRDYFIARVSRLPVGFGYVIDQINSHIGSDSVFQKSEVNALIETLQVAVKYGRTASGRGFIVPEGQEDYSKFRTTFWNAYVSAEYKVDCTPEDAEKLKVVFAAECALRLGYDGRDSYVLFAHEVDSMDGSIDGVISPNNLKLSDEASIMLLKVSGFSESVDDMAKSLDSWPSYKSTVKFMFESKKARDEFVSVVDGLKKPGLAIDKGVSFSGVDGLLQEYEAKKLNEYLSNYDANQGTGGTASPPREE